MQTRYGNNGFINQVDIEEYIAGVVRAEGRKNKEYIKTQAILARTYLYKYIDKHIIDGLTYAMIPAVRPILE